ncbi:hypothetical protein [Flavobacterium sp.]|uniref:hypothetical protein n=1 Tax=Flavobacterium sp. TaxID=239 RepID=UPI0039E6BD98
MAKPTDPKTKIGMLLTLALLVLPGVIYYHAESFAHADDGCGCSSLCSVYYPELGARLVGYVLMLLASIIFVASLWKFQQISRFWMIPALLVLGIAFYGNSYRIYNKGGCGFYKLYKAEFFFFETELGNFAKVDSPENMTLERLAAGKCKGQFLGYAIDGNALTLFRIGAPPVKVPTAFLLWKIRTNVIFNDFSYSMGCFRNYEAEKVPGHYEFIGGKGMTEQDFLAEFVLTEKNLTDAKLQNKRIITQPDGTTRFLFEAEPDNRK